MNTFIRHARIATEKTRNNRQKKYTSTHKFHKISSTEYTQCVELHNRTAFRSVIHLSTLLGRRLIWFSSSMNGSRPNKLKVGWYTHGNSSCTKALHWGQWPVHCYYYHLFFIWLNLTTASLYQKVGTALGHEFRHLRTWCYLRVGS